ncbi:MAG: hypothetical protein IJJ20_03450 [Thermoguttaceae bacterium]|nr:hypothetical protein [Thermoguttaceae bacterium]
MKADEHIMVNRVHTTPFNTVTQVLYSVITVLKDEVQDPVKKEHLEVLRQMVNDANWEGHK